MSFRNISFTKEDKTYEGRVWTIPSDVVYKARVIIFQNFNEPVTLYLHLINILTSNGYECFTYDSYNQTPKNSDEIRREMNRVLKLCCDDLDDLGTVPNHRVHFLAAFNGATRALGYGIDGYFRHRLKSIIAVNPVLKNKVLSQNFFGRMKLAVGIKHMVSTGLNISDITQDKSWQIKLSDVDYTTISNVGLANLCKIKSQLMGSGVMQFNVKNLLIIHSDDELCDSKAAEKIASKIDSEKSVVLGYPQGRGNLFFENKEVFELLMGDILKWLGTY